MKAQTKAYSTAAENRLMVPGKAQTKEEPTEAESSPKVSAKVQTTALPTEAESPPKVPGMDQTKESLKAALTWTVSEKASQKEPLKADQRPKGPARMMAFLKAPWNSTVRLKAQTKVEPTEAESQLMVPEKAQTMA